MIKQYLGKAAAAFVLAATLGAGGAYAQNAEPQPAPVKTDVQAAEKTFTPQRTRELLGLATGVTQAFSEKFGGNLIPDELTEAIRLATAISAKEPNLDTLEQDELKTLPEASKLAELFAVVARRSATGAQFTALVPAELHTKANSDDFKALGDPNLAALFAPVP